MQFRRKVPTSHAVSQALLATGWRFLFGICPSRVVPDQHVPITVVGRWPLQLICQHYPRERQGTSIHGICLSNRFSLLRDYSATRQDTDAMAEGNRLARKDSPPTFARNTHCTLRFTAPHQAIPQGLCFCGTWPRSNSGTGHIFDGHAYACQACHDCFCHAKPLMPVWQMVHSSIAQHKL